MCAVWVCVPSARPVPEVAAWVAKWRERGYYVALWRDGRAPGIDQFGEATMFYGGDRPYPGYAVATNELISIVFKADPSCDWVVATGDDTDPDMAHPADEIAAQCSEHFGAQQQAFRDILDLNGNPHGREFYSTFGVLQCTGDRWGDDASARAMWPNAPAMIDRIAGSPWIGREFARRINQGRGPLWPEYFHNWADQELQEVATKLGVFWQRRDLIHYHHHCMRLPGGTWAPHLKHADADYKRMKPVFDARQRMQFPGSEPIA